MLRTPASYDVAALAAARSQSVSVVLPARNEAETVGAIVSAIRSELAGSLVDEVVVIDSGSTDATAAVAAAAGARVARAGDVRADLGDRPGKGEALWKGLLATTGDIVVFLDADLQDFAASTVVGLVGPLLTEPGVAFVKAAYDRPLLAGGELLAEAGGRVTELVARPLLNAHWPALAGIVQPLGGEYAGRRSLLESVPFVTGYGVDLALLIDVCELAGVDAIAQVDVGGKRHRHQSDEALGLMAATIWATAVDRLDRAGWVKLTEDPTRTLTQFRRVDGAYQARVSDVTLDERPPVSSVR